MDAENTIPSVETDAEMDEETPNNRREQRLWWGDSIHNHRTWSEVSEEWSETSWERQFQEWTGKVSVAWIGKRPLLQYLRREKSQRVIWRLLTVHSWSTASDICHQATAPTSRHSHSLPCCQCHSWTYNSRSLRHRLVGDPYRCHWESASRSEVDGEYNPGLRGGEYEAIHHCIKYCWSPRRMQVRMWFHICVLQVKYTHLTYLRLLKLTNICLAHL